MAESRHARLKALFTEAVDLPPGQREAFLAESCPVDLRDELEELLDFETDDGFLAPECDSTPPPAAPAAARLDDGQLLGGYRILRELGAGGMGRVFEAEQDRPRRLVALKVVHGLRTGGELARRFEREAEVLGRLEHPGIARICEAGIDEALGVPFLAMELVDGVPLLDFARNHALDDRERLDLIARIADAVQHAHQKGVIHRDLKPGNVLVARSDATPRILDFGIARTFGHDDDLDTTRDGQVLGTVTHMSPEQAAGRLEDVDTRTDVYALGVLAFELLTDGEQPHDTTGLGLHAALSRIVETPARRLDQLVPRLRGDVATIVHKALQPERDRRYQSAAAFADDVRRYLGAQPIQARPATPWYQVSRFAARNRSLTAAAAVAILSLVGGTAVATWKAIEASEAAAQEREARQRAERRLGDVREFATKAVFEIHDEIKHLSGSIDARRQLLDVGHDALVRLQAEESDDPDLIREVAVAWSQQGRLRGGDTYHLGKSADATSCFETAITLWQRLLASDAAPKATDRSKLGLTHYRLAMLDLDARDLDAAEQRLRTAIEVMEPGLEAFPEHMDLPGDLGSVWTRLGRVLMEQERAAEALQAIETGLALNRESLLRAVSDEDRAYHLRGLIVSHNWLGNHHYDRGDLEAAETEYRQYLDYAEQVCALLPDDELDASNLAIAHKKLARVHRKRGALDAALQAERHALDVMESLAAVDAGSREPNLRRVSQWLDSTLSCAGTELQLGRAAAARETLARGLLARQLLTPHIADTQSWAWSCVAYANLAAELLLLQDDAVGALRELHDAGPALRRALAGDTPKGTLRTAADFVALRIVTRSRLGQDQQAREELPELRRLTREILDREASDEPRSFELQLELLDGALRGSSETAHAATQAWLGPRGDKASEAERRVRRALAIAESRRR